MAQTWLERAQVAERREAAPAGDVLPEVAYGTPHEATQPESDSEPNDGAVR
jgi:hypothetical protein